MSEAKRDEMSEDTPGDGPDSRSERIERALRSALAEPMLWPVALVVLGNAVAFATPAVLLGFRDRNIPACLALAIIVVLTLSTIVGDLRRTGRPSVLASFALVVWALSGVAAWGTHRLGIL